MQPKQCEESEKRARRNQIRERRVKEARNVRSLATLCFPMLLWRGSAICNDAFHTGFFFHILNPDILWRGCGFSAWEYTCCGCVAWQVQYFIWPSITFLWQTQCCRDIQAKKKQIILRLSGPHAEKLQFQPLNIKVARKSCRVASFSS